MIFTDQSDFIYTSVPADITLSADVMPNREDTEKIKMYGKDIAVLAEGIRERQAIYLNSDLSQNPYQIAKNLRADKIANVFGVMNSFEKTYSTSQARTCFISHTDDIQSYETVLSPTSHFPPIHNVNNYDTLPLPSSNGALSSSPIESAFENFKVLRRILSVPFINTDIASWQTTNKDYQGNITYVDVPLLRLYDFGEWYNRDGENVQWTKTVQPYNTNTAEFLQAYVPPYLDEDRYMIFQVRLTWNIFNGGSGSMYKWFCIPYIGHSWNQVAMIVYSDLAPFIPEIPEELKTNYWRRYVYIDLHQMNFCGQIVDMGNHTKWW